MFNAILSSCTAGTHHSAILTIHPSILQKLFQSDHLYGLIRIHERPTVERLRFPIGEMPNTRFHDAKIRNMLMQTRQTSTESRETREKNRDPKPMKTEKPRNGSGTTVTTNRSERKKTNKKAIGSVPKQSKIRY